ncbi:MAG TPA: cyclic pyranopterin monophosphate synthase MoaC [Candidatus Polarisedimenticolia bacterium]|nr:cyclic pyranopterin monophosphate synthase MoaC [Candidatus Polarisedimenticolia bacterium]
MPKLSHVNRAGKARMVDVGRKRPTRREAVARGTVTLSKEAFNLVRRNALAKGDVLAVAQVAGIQAAKRTWELIPLCHPLSIDSVQVSLTLRAGGCEVLIEARVRTRGVTGVEMEALTAVAVAGLTIYDMVKAADRRAVLGQVRLIEKRGGKSGPFKR